MSILFKDEKGGKFKMYWNAQSYLRRKKGENSKCIEMLTSPLAELGPLTSQMFLYDMQVGGFYKIISQ